MPPGQVLLDRIQHLVLRLVKTELRTQLDEAKLALDEAFDEMKKVEQLDERDQMRERAEETARVEAEFMRSA